jgi:4'-phosphopantetheinyl transferase EntD
MPPWPVGIVGSLTHCDGYRAAVVARVEQVALLGLDAEPHEPLPPGILELVSLPPERDQLRCLAAANPEVAWDRLLFCAKEAVYKAWFPRVRRWLGFEDAHILLSPTDELGGTFDVELVHPADRQAFGLGLALRGRWSAQHGLLLALLSADA